MRLTRHSQQPIDDRHARQHGATASDLIMEALAGMLQQPGRVALTALGTMLGIGAFVAVVGLTSTAGGQISRRFDALLATTVQVDDAASISGATGDGNPFPPDADRRVAAINGVTAAGVYWTVDDTGKVRGALADSGASGQAIPVVAASPGLLRAIHPEVSQGRVYDEFHDGGDERVAVLGSVIAGDLGITTLQGNPAVFIDGLPFTVVGIISDVARSADLLFSVTVPRRQAEMLWGPPASDQYAKMLISTKIGAADIVAQQVSVALRPDRPDLFTVTPPPSPSSLRDQVSSDFGVMFVILAILSLVVGAVGIANTTMVAVLERVPEIGLRRALGASRSEIAMQFLIESAAIGTSGGLVGTSVGVISVVLVSLAKSWTALLNPFIALSAPLIGTLVGVLAGLYPATRASKIEPIEALRR